ncbi:MAG: beta-galactosidase [Verrucomicrobiae bacterium]|nr:beta-galactosidase [Verrucomicrobiae bacterium]
MNLGVQYYRPPFPNTQFWDGDFAKIRESGLNAVQLWVDWAWVEPKPGKFIFDDYDRLVELAGKHRLGVVLSTIAETHPLWIHREVPGSEMIDHMGNKVVSSNRCEMHFGLTPGGCFDHPGVWSHMKNFLSQVASRYQGAPHLRGWDVWNELRWNVQADGLVCYCPNTINLFHQWLDKRYGGLDGLNEAWKRRYGEWSEVQPGKLPDRPYTEMMMFQHFLTWRANEHAKARYEVVKGIDPKRPVTVHGGAPSAFYSGDVKGFVQALDRGNDWFFADSLDGVGCSSFPKWGGIGDADFGMRIEFVKSAARGKAVWLSELQGGRAAIGFNVYAPVDALSQQRWIWNGMACGADTILFWCWRDEVFGRESAGFGLAGHDGLAEERLAAMKKTGGVLEKYEDFFRTYQPVKPRVGVLFSPQTYYLHWSQDGKAELAMEALCGYCRALVRKSIPYLVVEEEHLDALEGLKVLFLPRLLVSEPALEERLMRFVRNGGTLVCESECGAFDAKGFYRYPAERFLARETGICEKGRRNLKVQTTTVRIGGQDRELDLMQWTTPYEGDGKILGDGVEGPLVVEKTVEKGRVVFLGSYLGGAYYRNGADGFEEFIAWIAASSGHEVDAGVIEPKPAKDSFLYVKTGESQGRKVVFVFFQENHREAVIRFRDGFLNQNQLTDILTGQKFQAVTSSGGKELRMTAPEWRFAVLVEG